MPRINPWLLGALGGAAALYLAARTKAGEAIAVDAVEGVVVTAKRVAAALVPLGIRNNNPGNIEWIANPVSRWRGMIAANGRFGVFDTAANGVRAIGGELRASIRKGHTLAQAINEWAPPVENDTGAYVAHVEALSGYGRAAKLTGDMIPSIAAAIIRHENGQQPYKPSDIAAWVNS